MLLDGEMLPITGELGLIAAESTQVLAWWLEFERRNSPPRSCSGRQERLRGGCALRSALSCR